MELNDFVNSIKEKVPGFKSKNINEGQTKEWLIKPFFEVLGWQFSNPNEVVPEDDDSTGKKPDFGFYFNDSVKFFLEAKSINNPLDDLRMISEKINYCNNANVPFLIITNGINYKIYYIGLKGSGKDKLLQEFSILEDIDDEIIMMLTKEAFNDDQLYDYAKRKYIFVNVKTALENIFQKPHKKIIDKINNEIRTILGHKFGDDEIKEALKSFNLTINLNMFEENDKKDDSKKPDENNIYTIENQFKSGKWVNSYDLYNKLKKYLNKNNIRFVENPTKSYIGILDKDNNYFQVHGQKSGLKLFINIDYSELSEQEKLKTRDVSEIGRSGIGNTECIIKNENDFDWLLGIIRKAYDKI
ncbi:MAG: DUF5655 domain-containing protein [Candidatus Firestonebacteria bacterium]